MVPNNSPRSACAERPRIDSTSFSNPLTTDDSWTCSSRRTHDQATRAAHARNASSRRRYVDPTTCERDYSEAELEFMQAMQEYKHRSGRMFPTWSEVLEVLTSLGYEKAEDAD
jgi:hypothetical protein